MSHNYDTMSSSRREGGNASIAQTSDRHSVAHSWSSTSTRELSSRRKTKDFLSRRFRNLAARASRTPRPGVQERGNALQQGAIPDQGHPDQDLTVRSLRPGASMPSDPLETELSPRLAGKDLNLLVPVGMTIDGTISHGTWNNCPKCLSDRLPTLSEAVACHQPTALAITTASGH